MYTCLNDNSATIKDNARIEGTFEFNLQFSLKYNDKMLEYLAITRCVKQILPADYKTFQQIQHKLENHKFTRKTVQTYN